MYHSTYPEKLLIKDAGRPVATGSRGDPLRCALIYLFDRRRVCTDANPRHFIPLNVEVTTLSTQATRRISYQRH